MAAELPYFRFTPQEWQNGSISLESYELKGLFIDICSYYWIQDCSITIAMLEKRFSNASDLLHELRELGIIIFRENDYVFIEFLDNQFDVLSEKRKRRQLAGKKGGLKKSSNATAMLKQKPSYNDKIREDKIRENKIYIKSGKIEISNLLDFVKEKFQLQLGNWSKLFPGVSLKETCENVFFKYAGSEDINDINHLKNILNIEMKYLSKGKSPFLEKEKVNRVKFN